MSYRQILRLVRRANDAADVGDLILRMFDMAKLAPPIAEGFMGVPWGASRKQIIEIMNGQGFISVQAHRPTFWPSERF